MVYARDRRPRCSKSLSPEARTKNIARLLYHNQSYYLTCETAASSVDAANHEARAWYTLTCRSYSYSQLLSRPLLGRQLLQLKAMREQARSEAGPARTDNMQPAILVSPTSRYS
jgi:hypothetical protein